MKREQYIICPHCIIHHLVLQIDFVNKEVVALVDTRSGNQETFRFDEVVFVDDKNNCEMKTYIGTKVINAFPLTEGSFKIAVKRMKSELVSEEEMVREGYVVEYASGYKSWTPKEVFEQCYREVTEEEQKLMIAAIEIPPFLGRKRDVA